VRRKEMNRRKAQKDDKQHNRENLTHSWKGDGRGKGVGGFWVGTTWENDN
jgi:hypothetical protein